MIVENMAKSVLDTFLKIFEEDESLCLCLKRRAEEIKMLSVMPDSEHILTFTNLYPRIQSVVAVRRFTSSCIIEYVPLVIGGALYPYEPWLISVAWENEQRHTMSLMHELIHMYSLGKWNLIDDVIIHYVGVASHMYILERGKITEHTSRNVFLNEKITDFIAEYLVNNSAECLLREREKHSTFIELCKYYLKNDEKAVDAIWSTCQYN